MRLASFVHRHTLVLIAVGVVLGIVVGGVFPEYTGAAGVVGRLFLNALKFLVVPLIFMSVAVGIAALGDLTKIGRMARLTIMYYLVTTTLAVITGLILVILIQPGVGVDPPTSDYVREAKTAADFVDSVIPDNFFRALVQQEAIPIIMTAILFGIFLAKYREQIPEVHKFFLLLNDGILALVRGLMLFAPLGIFGLVAGILGDKGGWSGIANALTGIGKYALVVAIGLTIHAFITLPLILRFLARRSVLRYLYGISSALVTAMATASSSATLPETLRCSEENNQIDPSTAGFVLPLGATINMDGTALYEAVAVIFIAQSYGIELGLIPLIIVSLTATLASIGAAGIPQAGLVTMVLVMRAVGLPIEGIALILIIDWLLDRFRTTVNVWGDGVGAAFVDARR